MDLNNMIRLRLSLLVHMILCSKQRKTKRLSRNEPLSCWTWIYPAFANSVDPDQLASEEANWSESALFAIKFANLYQKPGLSNLIGWKLEVGVVHLNLFSLTKLKGYIFWTSGYKLFILSLMLDTGLKFYAVPLYHSKPQGRPWNLI